jgi:DNA modification methylase
VLFTQQPFTTTVAASNLKELRTEWIWEKAQGTNFLNAKKYPMKVHENILVFCDTLPPYSPQMSQGHSTYVTGINKGSSNYRPMEAHGGRINSEGTRYPRTVLEFTPERGLHPTQKPVALLEYLIRTYTNEGDTVLDCTMGSGSNDCGSRQHRPQRNRHRDER